MPRLTRLIDRAELVAVPPPPSDLPRDHRDRVIDFGRTRDDYERYRPGFPPSFFDRLEARGWIGPGRRAIDLGAGTGAMALGLAERGLVVTALDRAPELLEVLARRAGERALDVRVVEGVAEDTQEPPESFDLVTAAMCWWWFDARRVLEETRRILVPAGRILIAGLCYLPLPGSVASRTEDLILAHNPGWGSAGSMGIFPEQPFQLSSAGFREVETMSYDVEVAFTHEAWRGRVRACNGVAATLDARDVERLDRAIEGMLEAEFPGELIVPHRAFIATGVR